MLLDSRFFYPTIPSGFRWCSRGSVQNLFTSV
jgi:hypothetical protein